MGLGFTLKKVFFHYPLAAIYKLDDAKIKVEQEVFHKKHPVDRAYEEMVSAYNKLNDDLSELMDVIPDGYGNAEEDYDDYEEE